MIYITLSTFLCIFLHSCFCTLYGLAYQIYIVVSLSIWKLPAMIKFYYFTVMYLHVYFSLQLCSYSSGNKK